MKGRRRKITPTVDYGRDRARWADLARLARAQTEGGTVDGRARLAQLAGAAREGWTPAAPYPRGLVCPMLASTALAWARQPDAETLAAMGPLVVACCDLVERLLEDVATASPAISIAAAVASARTYRAPYRED